MTTKRHQAIDTDHEDELVVANALTEMIQDERWDLTDLGQQLLQSDQDDVHHHRLVICSFGKDGEPDDCMEPRHMSSDGAAVWRCECGYRICRGCFEVHSRHYAISVMDER